MPATDTPDRVILSKLVSYVDIMIILLPGFGQEKEDAVVVEGR